MSLVLICSIVVQLLSLFAYEVSICYFYLFYLLLHFLERSSEYDSTEERDYHQPEMTKEEFVLLAREVQVKGEVNELSSDEKELPAGNKPYKKSGI